MLCDGCTAWLGRDADIVSMGLTAFAALMGDAGAAAGEPLESYRATNESTGMPELSPLGRYCKRWKVLSLWVLMRLVGKKWF